MMSIFTELANIMHDDFERATFNCALHNALFQIRVENFREDGEEVEAHVVMKNGNEELMIFVHSFFEIIMIKLAGQIFSTKLAIFSI